MENQRQARLSLTKDNKLSFTVYRTSSISDKEHVAMFGAEMLGKLRKYEFDKGNGWKNKTPDTLKSIREALKRATADEDWVSVGNYAMMLRAHENGS